MKTQPTSLVKELEMVADGLVKRLLGAKFDSTGK